jgi:hypothetical protein
MMVIKFKGSTAKWNGEKWSSKDKYLLMTLNAHLPEFSYADLTFGTEQAILDALPIRVKVLRRRAKVIPDIKDVVY